MNKVVKQNIIESTEKMMLKSMRTGTMCIVMSCAESIADLDSAAFFVRKLTYESVNISEMWENKAEREEFWKDYIAEIVLSGTNYKQKLQSYGIEE